MRTTCPTRARQRGRRDGADDAPLGKDHPDRPVAPLVLEDQRIDHVSHRAVDGGVGRRQGAVERAADLRATAGEVAIHVRAPDGDSRLNGDALIQRNAVIIQVVHKGVRSVRNGTELFARHGLGTVHQFGNGATYRVRAILL